MSAEASDQAQPAAAPNDAVAIELGSRWGEAVSRCDVEALVEIADPDIAVYPTHLFGDHGPHLGHDGLHRWIADVSANDLPLAEHVTQVRYGQAGTVVALGHVLANGKPLSPLAMVITVRGQKIAEVRAYLSGEDELMEIGRIAS